MHKKRNCYQMDNSTSDNDNTWLPSKEERALVNYAIGKAKPKKLFNIDIQSIRQGECDDFKSYIYVLAFCLRLLVQRKMEISKLPPEVRVEIEKLMNGKAATIGSYKDIILYLGRIPNLPPKSRRNNNKNSGSRLYIRGDSWGYNDTSFRTQERTGFNSDFEYGITDT